MNIEELSDKELDILINTRLKMRKKNITSAQINTQLLKLGIERLKRVLTKKTKIWEKFNK